MFMKINEHLSLLKSKLNEAIRPSVSDLLSRLQDLCQDNIIDHLVLYCLHNPQVRIDNMVIDFRVSPEDYECVHFHISHSINDKNIEGMGNVGFSASGYLSALTVYWLDINRNNTNVFRLTNDVRKFYTKNQKEISEITNFLSVVISILEKIAKDALATERVDPSNPPFMDLNHNLEQDPPIREDINDNAIDIPELKFGTAKWLYVKTINGLIVRESVGDQKGLFGWRRLGHRILTYFNNKPACGIYYDFYKLTDKLIQARKWNDTTYSLFKKNEQGVLITWKIESTERFTPTTIEAGKGGLFTHIPFLITKSNHFCLKKNSVRKNFKFLKNASIVVIEKEEYYSWKPIIDKNYY